MPTVVRGSQHQVQPVRARHPKACRANAPCPTAPPACASGMDAGVRGRLDPPGHRRLRQRAGLPGPRHRALGPAADDDAGDAASSPCRNWRPATPWATAPASRPTRRCASAWSPAAMPTATRATAAPARRCWSTACARGMVGRVSMDMITVDLTPVPEAGFGARGDAVGPRRQWRRAGHRRGGARRAARWATS